MSIKTIIIVALGGSLGAILRYVTVVGVSSFYEKSYLATIAVNLVGSFLISLLSFKLLVGSSEELRLLFITGLLGAFTTMSSFSLDALNLWKSGASLMALTYVLVSVFGSLASCFLGFKLSAYL